MTHREGKIQILIADAQRLLAETLAISLRLEPDIEVIPEHPATGQAAIEAAVHHGPAVCLIDYWIKEMEGPAVASAILARAPHLRILLLSWFAGPGQVQKGLGAGALAFVPKTVDVPAVADAIRKASLLRSPAVSKSRSSLKEGNDDVSHEHLARLNSLTPREIEILSKLRYVGNIEAVAEEMAISPGTVRNHVHSSLKKLGAHSQLEAIAVARRFGFIA